MRFRMPAVPHGVTSLLWAVGLGGYILLGSVAIGIGLGTAVVVAVVAAFGIFLYVRVYGEDPPRRP